MSQLCDLHTHSVYSDGTWTPLRLIEEAERIGLAAVALTDHNTADGLPDFLAAAKEHHVQAVPGVEFSTDYHGTELHVLGLFLPEESFPKITALLQTYVKRKEQSNIDLVNALAADGYTIDYAKIRDSTPNGQVNRALIAAELQRQGYVQDRKEAFKKLLGVECGYYVPPERFTPFEIIRFIKSIGGVAVLAHPLLSMDEAMLRAFLPEAVACGLDGMETIYSTYDEETAALAASIAEEYHLKQSGGSDFHGENKPDIQLGVGRGNLQIPAEFCHRLARR